MLLIAVALAALTMFVAVSAEQRSGPAAGGWVTALPVGFTAALAVLFVGDGAQTVGAVAGSAAAHVPAQVVFAVAFAAGLRCRGVLAGLAAATAGYVAASCCLTVLTESVAVVVSVACLVVAPRLLPAIGDVPSTARHWAATPLTCAASSVVVLAAVIADHLCGPVVGGAAAAFPTMSGTLVVAVALRSGPSAGRGALAGLVRSLPCYLVFCLVITMTASALGFASLAVAVAATAATAALTWRSSSAIRSVRTPSAAAA